jgi:hypothetical protein
LFQGATSAERWQHLADLVEFAFALKEALDRINSQSFNSFMLRIGEDRHEEKKHNILSKQC